METLILTDSQNDIEKAAEIIKTGGLVAFPTETVYGLGADALNPEAVGKVYAAKGRPSDNPMIVHISSLEMIKRLTPVMTEDMNALVAHFWPGPLTMVVPRREEVPDVTTGGLDTVGVRMPSNSVARALIEMSGCPVAAPSANISGRPSPTTAKHVIEDLSGRIDAIIVSGDSDFGLESTVVDVTEDVPMILRPGVITKEMLESALEKEVRIDPSIDQMLGLRVNARENTAGDSAATPAGDSGVGAGLLEVPRFDMEFKPKAPGMKYKHYAPKAEMTVFTGDTGKALALMNERKEALEGRGKKVKIIDYSSRTSEEAARDLFRELREADEEGADVILALAIPPEGVGFAVMNRMLKSAGYNIVEV